VYDVIRGEASSDVTLSGSGVDSAMKISCWCDINHKLGEQAMHSEDEEIEFKESSGNVFADLGLENAEELFMRANLGISVYQILKEKKLKQRVIAQHLGISQSDVSHLMNGHFDRFSTDKLLDFLKLLDQKVTVQISARQKDEAAQQVILASYSGL